MNKEKQKIDDVKYHIDDAMKHHPAVYADFISLMRFLGEIEFELNEYFPHSAYVIKSRYFKND